MRETSNAARDDAPSRPVTMQPAVRLATTTRGVAAYSGACIEYRLDGAVNTSIPRTPVDRCTLTAPPTSRPITNVGVTARPSARAPVRSCLTLTPRFLERIQRTAASRRHSLAPFRRGWFRRDVIREKGVVDAEFSLLSRAFSRLRRHDCLRMNFLERHVLEDDTQLSGTDVSPLESWVSTVSRIARNRGTESPHIRSARPLRQDDPFTAASQRYFEQTMGSLVVEGMLWKCCLTQLLSPSASSVEIDSNSRSMRS